MAGALGEENERNLTVRSSPNRRLVRGSDRLIEEDESVDGYTLISAQGDRRWKARLRDTSPNGYSPRDDVYDLLPQGDDVRGFGGVKRLTRSASELLNRGWRIVT